MEISFPPSDFRMIVDFGDKVSKGPFSFFASVLTDQIEGMCGVEVVGEDEFALVDKACFLDAEVPGVIEGVQNY